MKYYSLMVTWFQYVLVKKQMLVESLTGSGETQLLYFHLSYGLISELFI